MHVQVYNWAYVLVFRIILCVSFVTVYSTSWRVTMSLSKQLSYNQATAQSSKHISQ